MVICFLSSPPPSALTSLDHSNLFSFSSKPWVFRSVILLAAITEDSLIQVVLKCHVEGGSDHSSRGEGSLGHLHTSPAGPQIGQLKWWLLLAQQNSSVDWSAVQDVLKFSGLLPAELSLSSAAAAIIPTCAVLVLIKLSSHFFSSFL